MVYPLRLTSIDCRRSGIASDKTNIINQNVVLLKNKSKIITKLLFITFVVFFKLY